MILSSCLSNNHTFHGKYNNSIPKVKNQVSLQEYFEPADFIKKDPEGWFKSLTPAYREVLGINAYFESRYEHNYVSQQTKGNMRNLSRETINRAENYFHSLGVGRITNCGFTSNVFKISNWFRKNNLAFGISKIIPAFFSICMLLPKPIVTQGYYNDIYIKKSNIEFAPGDGVERKCSEAKSLGNLLNRTLSNMGSNINTLKGEIAEKKITVRPLYERMLITKIAKVLRCKEEDIAQYDIKILEHIKNNHPQMKEKGG